MGRIVDLSRRFLILENLRHLNPLHRILHVAFELFLEGDRFALEVDRLLLIGTSFGCRGRLDIGQVGADGVEPDAVCLERRCAHLEGCKNIHGLILVREEREGDPSLLLYPILIHRRR